MTIKTIIEEGFDTFVYIVDREGDTKGKEYLTSFLQYQLSTLLDEMEEKIYQLALNNKSCNYDDCGLCKEDILSTLNKYRG